MTQRNPIAPSSGGLAELHAQCRADYESAAPRRTQTHRDDAFLIADAAASVPQQAEPSDLDVAISVAQQLLDSSSVLSLREALCLLLRAIGAESATQESTAEPRCPAAHPEDPTPCDGPVVVTVLDAQNAGAKGCEHHAARLLASLDGGRVYALPDAPDGAAIRTFKASDSLRPFPWLADAPRTRLEQLSRAENREGGEGR